MSIFFYVFILFLHWVGDFVCQTRYMADNKSKSWMILSVHVVVYTAILYFAVFMYVLISNKGLFWLWIFANFALHFATDAITSRMTSYYWQQKEVKKFFTTVGFDQFLHGAALLLTSKLILGV